MPIFELPETIEFGDTFGVMCCLGTFVEHAETLWNANPNTLPVRIRQCRAVILGMKDDTKA
jgi:hypothetical protein